MQIKYQTSVGSPQTVSEANPLPVVLSSGSGGAATAYKLISAATTNATVVKATPGEITSIELGNINAAARYLKLYNKATAPTVGTDTPIKTLIIPGNLAGAGNNVFFPAPISFSNGISFALTTGIQDSDTGAVAANEIVVNIDYR